MRFIYLLGAMCAATQISAQTLTLDQVPPIALTNSDVVSAISIDPLLGNVIARSSAGTLNQCTGTALPTILTFNSTPTSVNAGASFSLSWTSQNTTSCTPSQGAGTSWGTPSTLPSNGTQQLTAPANPTTLTFGLTCVGPGGSDSETLQVVVGGTGQTCSPPSGLLVDTPIPWQSVYPTPFPSLPGGRFDWASSPGRILSISFMAAPGSGNEQFGSITSFNAPMDGAGEFMMSISRDPGCFNPTVLGQNCLSPIAPYTSIGWSLNPSLFSCQLVLGQQYYLNATFGNATAPGSGPFCASAQCTRPLAAAGQRGPE